MTEVLCPHTPGCAYRDALYSIKIDRCAINLDFYMNAAAETLTQCALQDVRGRLLGDVLSIIEIGKCEGADRALLINITAQRSILIEYSASAIEDERGICRGAVTVFRDLTGRRASEIALQTSEESLSASAEALFEEKERAQVTLDSIGDAVISTDFRGHVTFLNKVAEKMTGWSTPDATGRRLEDIFFVVDSKTREQLPCSAVRAIIENQTIGQNASRILIRKDGMEIPVENSASPIHDKGGGVVGAVMVAHDVTVAREQADKLLHLALYDSLTGLPNRTLLIDRLGQAVERTRRYQCSVALLFIDLDHFKPVNDAHGHAVGDQLLRSVAGRLLRCVRESDTVSRYGGDEFVIMLADIPYAENAAICANKVIAAIGHLFNVGEQQLRLGASIGIASSPQDATDPTTLLKQADAAMYRAKASGGNNYKFVHDLDAGTDSR